MPEKRDLTSPGSRFSARAQTLQEAGLIRYRRGHIQIVDRQGLEAASCECYRSIREKIAQMFPKGALGGGRIAGLAESGAED